MTNKISLCLLLVVCLFTNVQVALAAGSSLEFSPSQISPRKGDQAKVSVKLNSSGAEVVGVDIFLKYDPSKIKIVDVVNLGVFPLQPAEKIDSALGEVQTAFSNNYGTYVTQEVTLAEIVLEAVGETGTTELTFDFREGKTTDTNVVSRDGRDMLSSVNSLAVTVSASSGNQGINGNPNKPEITKPPKKEKNALTEASESSKLLSKESQEKKANLSPEDNILGAEKKDISVDQKKLTFILVLSVMIMFLLISILYLRLRRQNTQKVNAS